MGRKHLLSSFFGALGPENSRIASGGGLFRHGASQKPVYGRFRIAHNSDGAAPRENGGIGCRCSVIGAAGLLWVKILTCLLHPANPILFYFLLPILLSNDPTGNSMPYIPFQTTCFLSKTAANVVASGLDPTAKGVVSSMSRTTPP